MKTITLQFLLFLSMLSFAQIKNGVVTYTVQKSNNNYYPDENNDYYKTQELNAKEIARYLTFTLVFNTKETSFKLNNYILNDSLEIGTSFVMLQIAPKLYQNKTLDIYRSYLESSEKKIITIPRVYYDWTLTKETKIINGYTCYKATSQTNYLGEKSQNPKLLVTAWYAPAIPVEYGPLGYGGLPGLILELEKYVATYTVKEIQLNLNKNPKIETFEEIERQKEEENK